MPRIEQRPQTPGSEHWLWPDGTHPVLRQVFSRREIESPGELDLALGRLRPVGEFASLDRGVDLLCHHRDGRVVIVGDFEIFDDTDNLYEAGNRSFIDNLATVVPD